jgi:hypothetical protein
MLYNKISMKNSELSMWHLLLGHIELLYEKLILPGFWFGDAHEGETIAGPD